MRETKTTTLTFFVSISVLLEWLERQGKKGWYLEEIRGDGLTARFRRGEPGPVRCRAVPAQEKTLDRDTIEEYADDNQWRTAMLLEKVLDKVMEYGNKVQADDSAGE